MKSRKQEPGGERCLKIGAWSTSFALAILLVGCTQQAQQQIEDTGKAVVVDVQESRQLHPVELDHGGGPIFEGEQSAQAVKKSQEAVADAEITASVKSALLASKKMDTRALNVDTVKGTVFLRGAVPTEFTSSTERSIGFPAAVQSEG